MAIVTAELVQPYRDRPNEGILSIFAEFSPMADPCFETGRQGELPVELGRIIDRGLRESWALDMEALCVISGRFVWAIRIDLHILDNGGNLIDAANIAVLAALMTFRRPDCSIEGVDDLRVTIHPPEEKEPLPFIIHHLPIAVTFGIFNEGNTVVIDPSHLEEAVMLGRITVTVNSNCEICAIQKAGGEGIPPSVITHCLKVACSKAAELSAQIENSVDSHNEGRVLRQVKQYSLSSASPCIIKVDDDANTIIIENEIDELKCRMEEWNPVSDERHGDIKVRGIGDDSFSKQRKRSSSVGHPLNWDPYSDVIPTNILRKVMIAPGTLSVLRVDQELVKVQDKQESNVDPFLGNPGKASVLDLGRPKSRPITLRDAVKPKDRRRRYTPLPSSNDV
ncbi:exosome complex component RRP45A-like isoform X2 [Wolffia australiana]